MAQASERSPVKDQRSNHRTTPLTLVNLLWILCTTSRPWTLDVTFTYLTSQSQPKIFDFSKQQTELTECDVNDGRVGNGVE